ncbi:MAG: stage II sporulation protein P, partial [Bacilli bacterium]
KTDFYGQLLERGWKYGRSYDMSRERVVEVMDSKQDVMYMIDIHRDTLVHKDTYMKIENKVYARMIFVIGGENKNYKQNLAFATRLHEQLEKTYPGISRGVTIKKGPGVNGVYNQDLSPRGIIVEVGGIDSTKEELFNSTDALAEAFDALYEGKRKQ